MMISLNDHQVRLFRLRAQRLDRRPGTEAIPVEQVLTEVCGVQGQVQPASRLSLRARAEGVTLAEI